MDREVIEQKLESLRRCLQRIEAKCPADAQTLVTDPDLQDIVTQIIKGWSRASKLPESCAA